MGTRGVEGAYQGALRAFQNPMLALPHQTHAPFVVTVLAMVFTAERPRVAVADSHAEINDALDQLRAAGYGDEDNADAVHVRQESLFRPDAPPEPSR
ncbi:DUF3375 family protein [Microbispora hainanensis]|uniref:DUF3375 family protein n=1 Tax=Microbispora hainanensis TaxID=568844 RepID=UPI0033CBFF43